MREEKISVVLVEPGKRARVEEVDSSLEGMQRVVGGLIQAIYPFEDHVAIVCNEEAKLSDLPLNRALCDSENVVYDIIAGTFFIAGCGVENFVSLTPEQIEFYKQKFLFPEKFVRVGRRMNVVRYDNFAN